MGLDIGDNIWSEFKRMCELVATNRPLTSTDGYASLTRKPSAMAAFTIRTVTQELENASYRKTLLGEAWKPEMWEDHPTDYVVAYDVPGADKLELPNEVTSKFIEHATHLGYDPSKLANRYLARHANYIAENYLSPRERGPAFKK